MLLLCCVSAVRAQYDKDVFMFRGRQALSEGRYSDAISQFNILARLDTSDCWVYFYRGIAKYNLGDIRGALGDFDSSVSINPVFTNKPSGLNITDEMLSVKPSTILLALLLCLSLLSGLLPLLWQGQKMYSAPDGFRSLS